KFSVGHESEPFTGVIEGQLTGFRATLAAQLAVDSTSHNLYVESFNETPSSQSVRAYQADGKPADFTAGPSVGTNEISGSEICGVAVDASGDIYVSEFTNGVQVFAPSGAPLTTIAVSGACNLAVDSHGVVYANVLEGSPEAGRSGPVEKLNPSGPPPVTASTT